MASYANVLEGKVAIITGASSGIGRSTARALADAGANVVLVGRDTTRLDTLRDELNGQAITVPVDVTAVGASISIVDAAIAEYGRIDIVFANAGLFLQGKVAEADEDSIRRTVDVNVTAAVSLIRTALPLLLEQNSGDILLTSSIAGHQELASEPVYSASKHAARAFAQALRRQLAGTGVRVAEVAPGIVLTDLWGYPEGDDRVAERLEAGTGIRAEDVADAILYMLTRPAHVTIRDLVILPTSQSI
ncbi:SDR family oxidoreductase [Microbacterium jejuense]|uniref:SDR family oxidoreductase n=1 Tax=Microbacterium jejuense TaxID=1263637 RepID=A0ABS7HLF0_9MICO|nr:SDR family oxidoreductase [Microbacterium jejuense]MBW9093057.1 SDR family oxidoreductase [Microbacterium jejuense]